MQLKQMRKESDRKLRERLDMLVSKDNAARGGWCSEASVKAPCHFCPYPILQRDARRGTADQDNGCVQFRIWHSCWNADGAGKCHVHLPMEELAAFMDTFLDWRSEFETSNNIQRHFSMIGVRHSADSKRLGR
jgi:hypothetical protein